MREEYDKLVRDRVPEVIRAAGKRCRVEVMDEEGYAQTLRAKLIEEAVEAGGASAGELAAELGDVLEVVAALAASEGLTMADVEAAQRAKRRGRGGFDERLRLVWVEEDGVVGNSPPSPIERTRPRKRPAAQAVSDSATTDAYAGIDVAFATGKLLPVCVCKWQDGRLIPLPLRRLDLLPPRGRGNAATLDLEAVEAFAHEAVDYLARVEATFGVRIRTVAIDSPSAPKRDGDARRLAERAMDGRRISCFATPSRSEFEEVRRKARAHLDAGGAVSRLPHANQLWMLVGFALFNVLGRAYDCIEVYPQATVAALGAAGLHKSNRKGLDAQLDAVAAATGWPTEGRDEPTPRLTEICYGSAHDKLDAYLAAWVAALPEGKREACGVPPHDVIWIPRC